MTTVDLDFYVGLCPGLFSCVVDPFQTEPDEHCPASTSIKPGPLFPTEVHDLATMPHRGGNSF